MGNTTEKEKAPKLPTHDDLDLEFLSYKEDLDVDFEFEDSESGTEDKGKNFSHIHSPIEPPPVEIVQLIESLRSCFASASTKLQNTMEGYSIPQCIPVRVTTYS